MPSTKLSQRSVEAAAPSEKPYVLYDETLKGFGLRVMPSGHKSWIIEYRPVKGGRSASTRRMSIGDAVKLTAVQARAEARNLLADVRLGGDPAGTRQKARSAETFSGTVELFIRDYCVAPNVTPRTARLYADNLRRIACPMIGNKKIADITRADIQKLHKDIGEPRVGEARRTTANNVLVSLGSLFNFASEKGIIEAGQNPAKGLKKFKTIARERYLSGDELARLGTALREAETNGLPWYENDLTNPDKAKHRAKDAKVITPPDIAGALRLLLFTGCRKSEILGLKWSEVNFEQGFLDLPATKTGRRAILLNPPALSVLAELPRVGDFVFPGAKPGEPRGDITGHWYRIRQSAGLDGNDGKPPLRLHDVRHSFASAGVSGGLNLPIVGKLLGHAQFRTTERYAHLADDPVRRASNTIGAGIAAAMGESTQDKAEQVRVRRGR